jgi:hypothetical protein
VKKRVTNITKVLRGELRGALGTHEPYNQATAAYAQIAPLYSQGIAPKLRRMAVEAPESIITMLNPKKPTSAHFLQDLLTTQAAAGGGEAEGRAAWDSVRSAWTHERVVKGGLAGLGKRMDAVEGQPAFHQVLYGDDSGKQVWQHLRTIQQAYETAVSSGERAIEEAKARGQAGVEAARRTGRESLRTVRETVAEPAREARRTGLAPIRAEEQKLASSSIARAARESAGGATRADVLRALVLGRHYRSGLISIAHLMQGPTASDLVYWASMSPTGTKRLVWALTSPTPGLAVANLVRSSGILGEETNDEAGSTPPEPETPVGQPPPSLPPGAAVALTVPR